MTARPAAVSSRRAAVSSRRAAASSRRAAREWMRGARAKAMLTRASRTMTARCQWGREWRGRRTASLDVLSWEVPCRAEGQPGHAFTPGARRRPPEAVSHAGA